MARRYSRRRTVKARPNYCWISTAGAGVLVSVGGGCTYDNILIPSDWQSGNIVENETLLVHCVYTHAICGGNTDATNPYCSIYSIFKTNDATPATSPPNLSILASFPPFFVEYDECLHWGQYTAMPYNVNINLMGSAVWPAGGSLAGMPENMVNLNLKRKLKGDDAIKVAWGSPTQVGQEYYSVRWYARSLVRLGLK